MKVITTNQSTISKNQLFLITYRTNKNGTKRCLYKALSYSVVSLYADKTLSSEIDDYAYIVNVTTITNTLDLRKYGYTFDQARVLLGLF